MDKRQILLNYKNAKIELAKAQAVVDSMKDSVVEALKELPNQKAQLEGASFSLRPYRTYTFSKDVTELQITIKELQAGEIKTGKAKIKSETFAPIVNLPKVKKKGGEK